MECEGYDGCSYPYCNFPDCIIHAKEIKLIPVSREQKVQKHRVARKGEGMACIYNTGGKCDLFDDGTESQGYDENGICICDDDDDPSYMCDSYEPIEGEDYE